MGRTVYQRLETDWKNSGFTKGVLNVDLKNTAGILFWIKMGLKPSTLHSTRTPAKKGQASHLHSAQPLQTAH